MNKQSSLLNEKSKQEIDKWLKKYPYEYRRSALLPALHIAQAQNAGFLTGELMEAVADYIDIPPIFAFEAATFYSMYDLKPIGRHKINVCTNVSCMLNGCDNLVKHLNKRLGIAFNQTTKDGKFTLKEVECLAACAGAPALLIDKTYYENVTPEKLDDILDNLE